MICFDPSLHRIEDDSKDPFIDLGGMVSVKYSGHNAISFTKLLVSLLLWDDIKFIFYLFVKSSQKDFLGFSCFFLLMNEVSAGEIHKNDDDCSDCSPSIFKNLSNDFFICFATLSRSAFSLFHFHLNIYSSSF